MSQVLKAQIISKLHLFIIPENTHLCCKGKYHCASGLLFDQLGFSCFVCVELDRDLQVWLDPNQSNRRSAVQ